MTIRLKRLARLHGSCSSSHKRPYVALEHIEGWTGKLIEGVELPVLTPASSGMATTEVGDVLFGKLRPYLAKSWVVDRPALASTELMCIRPGPAVDSRWLGYMMSTVPFVEWAIATSDGTRMPRTSWEKIGEYRPRIPSRVEQLAIADYLDTETDRIDTVISKRLRMLELLSERLRSFAIALITGEGRGKTWTPGPYWLGPVPLAWQPHKVAWHKRTASGTTPESSNSAYYDVVLGVPWITTSELRETTIRKAARRVTSAALQRYSALKLLPVGTVLIAMYGATVGRLGVLGTPAVTNQACCAVYGSGPLDQRFLYWWLWANRAHLISMSYGAGQPNVSQDIIRSLRIPAPEVGEQQEIASRIEREASRNERMASKLIRLVELLAERRQALITAVISGEMAVPGVSARTFSPRRCSRSILPS